MNYQSLLWGLLFLTAVHIPAAAQRTMSGKVVDEDGHPVPQVQVSIAGTNIIPVFTDQQGQFAIFAALRKKIVFRKEGFIKHSFTIDREQSLHPTIQLSRKVLNKRLVQIRGRVLDWASGKPLVGATIRESGSSEDIISGVEGYFELQTSIGKNLLIRYGPYQGPEEFPVENGGDQIYRLHKPKEDEAIYGRQSLLMAEDFTVGNIHNPLQLIQGRIPGSMISKGGGNDPFGKYSMRLHGLSTFDNRLPLIVVDGLPNADLHLVDPLDIQSIKVIRDGTAALYGIQGSNGVIEIKTSSLSKDKTEILYRSYLGADMLHQTVDYLDADSYRSISGATDRGHSTNWFEEITGTGLSHAHHLSLSSRLHNRSGYQVSATYRSAEGILNRQHFERLQLNAHFKHSMLHDKLLFSGQLFVGSREDNYSEPAAFRYAQSYNPTAPVYDPASDNGYFSLRLFDYHNPLEMIDLTENSGSSKFLLNRFSIIYNPAPNLRLGGAYRNHNRSWQNGRYTSKHTEWLSGTWYNGYAQIFRSYRQQHVFDTYLTHDLSLNRSNIQLRLGHQYQIINDREFSAAGGDFLTDAFSFRNLGAAGNFREGLGRQGSEASQHRLSAIYGTLRATWNDWLVLNAGWRTEGSSRLGTDNRWGHFPHIALNLELHHLLNGFFARNLLQVRGSYGITGNLPVRSGLSQLTYGEGPRTLQSLEFRPSYALSTRANPDLKWEAKRAWTMGIDLESQLAGRPLRYGLTMYRNKIKDIIRPIRLLNDQSTTYRNIGGLQNRGIELEANYTPVRNRALQWNTEIQISANTTILDQYYSAAEIAQYDNFRPFVRETVPHSGCCKAPTINLSAGEEIGGFWVLKHLGIDESGRWIYADVDGDGRVDDWLDVHDAGNGLPNWTVGWSNRLKFKNLDFGIFFRGAFGHHLFNSVQKLGEAPSQLGSEQNLLSSSRTGDTRRLTDLPQESSRFVQKASFLRLESLSAGYSFSIGKPPSVRNLRLYLAAQNLLTMTGYQGWDPEFRLLSGDQVFAPGYEHRTDYLPTRSMVFGMELNIR